MTRSFTSSHSLNQSRQHWLRWGSSVLQIESQAIAELATSLGNEFEKAIEVLLSNTGRIVVTGMGKSGHIGRKMAATFASTGAPAFFLHPAEALHGDLGMVTEQDVVIALSHSGESEEVLTIVPHLKRLPVPIISITGKPESTLAQASDLHLCTAVSQEACPLGLAPTTSTTVSLALGDALAMVLLQAHGFSTEDFARSHPGGSLGRRLLTRVRDIMHTGTELPRVHLSTPILDALGEISQKGMGMTLVVDDDNKLQGLFTDGDLRRAAALHPQTVLTSSVAQFMTRKPRTIHADILASEAVSYLEHGRITQLLVIDDSQNVIGALHLHDLLQHKLA
ncbi:MAG: KpsF/GutQ family sugar-phosphate isomerase [Pseudomonadota bacterium]